MSSTRSRIVQVALFATLVASLAGVQAVPASSVSQKEWTTLNTTVQGRLSVGVPFSRPCFPVANNTGGIFEVSACGAIQENYTNRTFRRNFFGSFMNTEWETCQATSSQCLLDSTDPTDPLAFTPPRTCSQGSIPPYFIDVENTNDIIAGFKFAKQNNVILVVKNTGHDYKGRSSAPDALSLFTHNFDSLSFSKNFKPTGCSECESTAAVTMGAGVTFLQVYDFADANNVTIPGGADPTVGAAGGYLMGGGHSILSNAFGLFVDRLLEVEVVVPTGEVLTANECQNSDLFFAIRGGGGGTFGVVTSVTTLALPKMQIPVFSVTASSLATNITKQQEWLNFISSKAVALSETGWGGFVFPDSGMVYTNPLISDADATAAMQDILDFATTELNATIVHIVEPSYLSFYNDFIANSVVPIGLPFATASRLIPVANFATEDSRAELVNAILPATGGVPLPIIFQVTPLFFGANGGNTTGTSVTPAWRNSMWHVTTSTFWNFNTTFEESVQIFKNLTTNMDVVRNITPNSGAYQNEADVYEPNFEESFWGSNYNKLLSIKNKYDPDHILDCWQCVGFKGTSSPQFSCYIPATLV
ncbi:hypothetical protein M0805_002213 [Coniferiporia weirii]|nr:hypothetical protein M0805_002213 [Coniferiporia weirii]